jgi:RHH-type transcriptional regulator, rel operon repressor / antitoxin RelB
MAAEAIAEYVEANEWQIAGIEQAIKKADAGRVVPHDDAKHWVESWGTERELPMPDPPKR